jgi:hypothetical protein
MMERIKFNVLSRQFTPFTTTLPWRCRIAIPSSSEQGSTFLSLSDSRSLTLALILTGSEAQPTS